MVSELSHVPLFRCRLESLGRSENQKKGGRRRLVSDDMFMDYNSRNTTRMKQSPTAKLIPKKIRKKPL